MLLKIASGGEVLIKQHTEVAGAILFIMHDALSHSVLHPSTVLQSVLALRLLPGSVFQLSQIHQNYQTYCSAPSSGEYISCTGATSFLYASISCHLLDLALLAQSLKSPFYLPPGLAESSASNY